MLLTSKDIAETPKIRRLNIINAISGIKPANLIATISPDSKTNLAIISNVIHIGSNPAHMGYISRPKRQTLSNIRESGFFTINHVHESFIEQAHYTSAKFEPGVSEFEQCALSEAYIDDFPVPFVKESPVKIGLKLKEIIPIKSNETWLVIGQILLLQIPDETVADNGYIDMEKLGGIGVSGLNNYYRLKKIKSMPYARTNELPKFKKQQTKTS